MRGRRSGEAAKGTHKRSLWAVTLDGIVRHRRCLRCTKPCNETEVECVAIATDEHNILAMLVRRPNESLDDLLQRLDAAIEAAYEYDHFTDEVNGPQWLLSVQHLRQDGIGRTLTVFRRPISQLKTAAV